LPEEIPERLNIFRIFFCDNFSQRLQSQLALK
jgi:hypothetical protein